MASEALQLAILLTLKDAASGGLDRFASRLRAAGKDGEKFAKDYEKIRSELNRDLAIGGVGMAGLATMRKGIEVAARFQDSMTDLRTTFSQLGEDGNVNLDTLGKDMRRAEVIAFDLGNRLPGTTEDFVQMMQVLKQNGLQAETIFNGAGKAVGELAVANKQLPKDVAKDFAQFGQLFRLKPEEYERAADVFSRLFTSTGIGSSELIEASKYFQGRTGSAIGIGGLKDAEEMTRLFGLMRKQGMEGSMAGTAMDNFFVQYLSEKKKMQAISKEFGVKLDFFDEGGKFKGIENLFKELEPLRKLSDKDQAQALQGIFGQRGMAAASMMVKTGLAGWKQFNAEQDQTIGLLEKNAEISKNFNNQVEALTGSLSNLVVAGFEPMLPGLTSAATLGNNVVGMLTDFAKANPGLMQTLGTIGLYGSTAMVAYAGIKTLTSGFRLMRLALAFSKSESAGAFFSQVSEGARTAGRDVGFFTQRANGNIAGFTGRINAAEKSVSGFTKQVGGLKGAMSSIAGSSAVKIGVQIVGIMAAEAAITGIMQRMQDVSARQTKLADDLKNLRGTYDDLMGRGLLYNKPGDFKGEKGRFDAAAGNFYETISESGMLMRKLHPERTSPDDSYFKQLTGAHFWEDIVSPLPYGTKKIGSGGFWGPEMLNFNPKTAAQRWNQQPGVSAMMRDPNMIARIVSDIKTNAGERGMTVQDVDLLTQTIRQMAEMAGPGKWETAMEILAKESAAEQVNQAVLPLTQSLGPLSESFVKLNEPTTILGQTLVGLQDPFKNLGTNTDDLGGFLRTTGVSARSAANALDGLSFKISSWQPPTQQSSFFGSPSPNAGNQMIPIFPPPKASGGRVRSDGLVFVHKDEDIVPANVTSRYEAGSTSSATSSTSAGGVTIRYQPQITINGGGKDAKRDFQEMLNAHSRDIERIVARAMSNGRARA